MGYLIFANKLDHKFWYLLRTVSNHMLRPEGGGGKRHFFSFYICDRAAEDEQVEKNRIKIRQCIPEILHAKV